MDTSIINNNMRAYWNSKIQGCKDLLNSSCCMLIYILQLQC